MSELRKALKAIARRSLLDEADEIDGDLDFEADYDAMILAARAALSNEEAGEAALARAALAEYESAGGSSLADIQAELGIDVPVAQIVAWLRAKAARFESNAKRQEEVGNAQGAYDALTIAGCCTTSALEIERGDWRFFRDEATSPSASPSDSL